MDYDIVIVNAKIMVDGQDESGLIDSGYVTIKDRLICAVGPMASAPLFAGATQIVDASDSLVMPGLVNTHNHAAMTLFRGLADDLPLMTWLQEHIFPAEARYVNPEMVYWSTKLAAAEMLLSGTTTVADGYFHEDVAAAAFRDSGIRAVAAQGVIDFPAPGVQDPAGNIDHAEGFIKEWQGKHRLISPAVFCHSPYTCGPETLKNAKRLSRRYAVPLFIHVAETRDEVSQIREQHGMSPVRYLHDLGILDPSTVCVHCVWLDDDDIDIMAQSGAGVATCPESNMKLASGVAPVHAMMEKGIAMGLGTDGCASNNDLDLFREMDLCAKLHKVVHHEPTLLPASKLLAMATHDGAKVLGMDHLTGSIAPGKFADLIIVDLKRPHLTPFYSSVSTLVYGAAGADVTASVIDGRLVMRDRQILTFDVDEAMEKVRELSREVIKPT